MAINEPLKGWSDSVHQDQAGFAGRECHLANLESVRNVVRDHRSWVTSAIKEGSILPYPLLPLSDRLPHKSRFVARDKHLLYVELNVGKARIVTFVHATPLRGDGGRRYQRPRVSSRTARGALSHLVSLRAKLI